MKKRRKNYYLTHDKYLKKKLYIIKIKKYFIYIIISKILLN